jgi:hypothetical protein
LSYGSLAWGEIIHVNQPLDLVADFGERTAWYFAWLGFYTKSLLFPSLVGFVVFILSFTHPELPTLALYSMFISVWATCFLELWGREQAIQAYLWDVDAAHYDEEELSQQFTKQMRHLYMDDDTGASNLQHLQSVLPGVDATTIKRDIEDFDLWFYPQSKRSLQVCQESAC